MHKVQIRLVTDWYYTDVKGNARKRFGYRITAKGAYWPLSADNALKLIQSGTAEAVNKPTADALAKLGA